MRNDFNGDGQADLLWRNPSNGKFVIHLIDDFVKVDSSGAGTVPVPPWDMVGTGDFSRDCKADILWRNTSTGATIMWQMDGFARTAGSLGIVPLVWQIKAITDYDGDGNSEIPWHNSSNGSTVSWEMNGFIKTASHGMGNIPTVWQIED